jgi:sulfite reductase alpha subunit-like flavoprotein
MVNMKPEGFENQKPSESKERAMREASDLPCLKIKIVLDNPKKGENISVGQAMSIVAKENPDLVRKFRTGKP